MAQEGRDTLQAQVDLAPDIFAARSQYEPLYADLDITKLRRVLFGSDSQPGLLQTYREAEPALTEFASTAASGQRERDIADVERLGARATDALRAANPEAAALERSLLGNAQAQLDAGASLDPQLRQVMTEQVRQGQADRGMGYGPADVYTEQAYMGKEAEALRARRQDFAQGVLQQSRAGSADPFLAILGRSSGVQALAPGVMGQGQGFGANAQQFDPWNAYSADLYNTNYNAAASAGIANANNQTALMSAGIQAAGSMGSSM